MVTNIKNFFLVFLISLVSLPLKTYSFDYTKSVEKEKIGEFKLLDSLLDHLD